MDYDDPSWPLIDSFFEQLADGRKAVTVRRYARVRHRLYDFLDVDDMTEWLETDEVTLLAAEREFGREGAVRAVVGVDGLLRCLPGFLGEDLLPVTTAEARMQISVVNRLVPYVSDRHPVPKESLLVARRAVLGATRDLDARLRDPALHVALDQIDARFKQQPGPQW